MDAIYFIHHKGLTDPLTRKHFILLKAMNPDCEMIPVCFEKGRGDSEWQWKNCDLLVLEHFNRVQPNHERYFIAEWDTMATMSFKEFYGPAYNFKAAASDVILPWSNRVFQKADPQAPQRHRDWHWWSQNESAEIYPYLRGMAPISGSMFSHDCLFSMVQLWKTNRDFDKLFCECRLGTLAAMSGFEPKRIREDGLKFISWDDVDESCGPGVYHRARQ